MKFLDIFPIGVGVETLASLTPDLIARAIELIDRSPQFDGGADGTYTNEQNFLDDPLFVDVKQEVVAVCKAFTQGYAHEVPGIGICNSWANVVAKGQGIPAHKHNNSYISGSFYLTHGSVLSITNPMFLNLFGFMPRVTDNNPRSYAAYKIKPEPGMVIVFPSGLFHGVATSQSEHKRYSVAFNAIPLGLIGLPTSFIDLKLS